MTPTLTLVMYAKYIKLVSNVLLWMPSCCLNWRNPSK